MSRLKRKEHSGKFYDKMEIGCSVSCKMDGSLEEPMQHKISLSIWSSLVTVCLGGLLLMGCAGFSLKKLAEPFNGMDASRNQPTEDSAFYKTALANLTFLMTSTTVVEPTREPVKTSTLPAATLTPMVRIEPPSPIPPSSNMDAASGSGRDQPAPVSPLQPSNLNAESYWSYADNLYSGPAGPSNQSPLTYWRYGPQKWGNLRGYELCGMGRTQSPIDLSNPVNPGAMPGITFRYVLTDIKLISNDNTFQADVPTGNYVFVDSVPYELLDFTFHRPAEHTINGRIFDMELQLTHQNASGQQLVVSVLLQQGNPNAALAPLWANMPPPPYSWRDVHSFDLAQLLPKDNGIFIYNGSLSMPPCNEGILWVVFASPLGISPAQLSAYQAMFPNPNARPLQALNGRPIQWGTAGF